MKTSNKLLLVLALAAFLSTASVMLYAKSQLVDKETLMEEMKLSGNLIDRVLHEDLTTDDIEMGDNFSWVLDPNSTQVLVSGDETIVSKLTVSDNGQFQIRTGEYGDYNSDYDVVIITVGIKNLSNLRIDGNGNARITSSEALSLGQLDVTMNGNARCTVDVNTSDIKLGVNGNARVTLTGACEKVNAHVNGNAKIYAEEGMNINSVMVSVNGNGRFYAGSVEEITGSASGNGKIKVEDARMKDNVSTSGNGRFTINR